MYFDNVISIRKFVKYDVVVVLRSRNEVLTLLSIAPSSWLYGNALLRDVTDLQLRLATVLRLF